jgi:hypothetical protein
LWDATPSSVISLLPPRVLRLLGTRIDLSDFMVLTPKQAAMLPVGAHEIARNRVTATSSGPNRRSKSTNPRQRQGTLR